MKILLRPNLNAEVARSEGVTDARLQVAADIAATAEKRSRISRAKGKFRAEVERSQDPPRVAAIAGEQRDKSFITVFEEFGGSGFRPPPAPMRTAAEKYGRVTRS